MATIISFNVQYYNAHGNLILTKQINFNDTNYGTEDTPEYYSSSPNLSGYTNAYVEDAFGEPLSMEVLDDGSFMTNSEDWMLVFSSATGPLKAYSSDFEGGESGGNTPSTGVLQGTTHVALVDENNGQVIWEEDVNLYTGGDEYTPCIEGRLSIPQDLLNQYTGWYVASGYYYDSFYNGYLTFYTWDDTLFNEDLIIMGYRNYIPEETLTIYYEDPTGYYSSESDSYSGTPGEGINFYPRDWSDRTDANGNRFLCWEDADGIQYTAEFSYYVDYDLTLYAVWETTENPDSPIIPDAPVITGEEVYFIKVNGVWRPGKMYFKLNSEWK